MASPTRKILFALMLLGFLGLSISALSKLAPTKIPAAPATEKSAITRTRTALLKHEDGEMIVEWKCPDIQTEYDPETHRISSILMPGAQSCEKTGVPRLPEITQMLDCLPGQVTAQIVDVDAETRQLGSMLAMPEDVMIDPPADSANGGVHRSGLDEGVGSPSWSERCQRTPLLSGMWPPQMVSVQDAGVFRGHRLMALNIFPVQVDAQRGIAHIIKRVKVRVTMPHNATAAGRLPDQADETDLVRKMLGDLGSTALPSRMTEALQGRGNQTHGRLDDFDPLHPRWKIIVNSTGIVRITARDLRFAGCPIEQITARDVHIKNRGHEVPCYFSGEGDNRFDEGDYIDFYGVSNTQTYRSYAPTFYQDPWTSENVYWLSWGDGQPGLRLADEDASYHNEWPINEQHVMSAVRTTVHAEQDSKFERLPASTEMFGQQLMLAGPLGLREDHWFWGAAIEGLTSRNYTINLPFPATSGPEALHNITMRAALEGYTFSDFGNEGQHRVIIYLNGQTAPGLQGGKISQNDDRPAWSGQTPIILQTRPTDSSGVGIVSGDLRSGYNTITVSLPGDGLAGANDKVLANWFEVDYDRALHADYYGSIEFPFDTTRGDTFAFEVRGFLSNNINCWKLGHSRLTNLSTRRVAPADENPSWAARFQIITDGAYDILVFDNRFIHHPAAILPERSNRDLRTLNGARYLVIYHDSFADDPLAKPWLDRLDSLRRVTFNGSVDTIRVSQVYEQFNDGIVNPDAIHNFLQYAYENWPVRPTHVCIVGDGVMENKYSGARAGDLISSLYPLTEQYGAVAADMLFGMVSGPPWDIIPDIAIGRISCRSTNELQTYVQKLIAYETPSQTAYSSLYHATALFVADKDAQFHFDRNFSEPVVKLLPDAINVTRVYLDSLMPGAGPNVLRDEFRNGAVLVDYNGHGGGGVWSGTQLIDVAGVRQLNNHKAYPFITNFTCYVGAFDAINQADVLGEAFEFGQNSRLDPVGGIGVYATTGPGWAIAGSTMQLYLYDFCAIPPGMTLGEIVQLNKSRFWGRRVYNWGQGGSYISFDSEYSMMMMMTLLGDPGVRLFLPQHSLSDVHSDISMVSITDSTRNTLHVSGTLPWDPSSSGTELYLLPYNGPAYTYTRTPYWDPVRQETTWTVYASQTTSHIPALNTDIYVSHPCSTRNFSNIPVPITSLFHTPQGAVVAYAVDLGPDGQSPQDAIGSFPIFLADSLTGLRIYSIEIQPDRGGQLGAVKGYIGEDSSFTVQVTLSNQAGVAAVKARGIFQPAQGPVVLDTVDLVQDEPGTWHTPVRGPYNVFGGSYRIKFLVQPAAGGDFAESDDYDIPVEGRSDYLINTSNGIVPRPAARKQPSFYLPLATSHGSYVRDVADLPVRLTAIHDSLVVVHRPSLPDTMAHVAVDSFASDLHVTDLANLPALFEVWIPTYFWPQSYNITIKVDPDSIIPEINEGNNRYTTSIAMPNLYPATNALGTYMPRTAEGNTFHRYWAQGITDTIRLKLPPGSLPMDSTTLIYQDPQALSAGDLAILQAGGLFRSGAGLPDTLRDPVNVFRVTMTDSSDALAPGSQAQVSLNFSHILDSTEVQKLYIFEKRSVSSAWRKLDNRSFDYVRRDTVVFGSARYYLYAGRISATTPDIGNFAVFLFEDNQGPQIEISVDGMHFTPHSILPRHPQIFANLSDPSGINREAGKFYFILDNDTIPDVQISWSDTLKSSGGMSALIRPDLEPGHHTLRVKATDNNGISDSTAADFEVAGGFGIEWAINYPNPFQRSTTIAYLLTDQADNFVECKIFSVSGRYIRTVSEVERAVANYREIVWDGRDKDGVEVANGVYFARLRAKQGKQQVEKMIKLAKVR